MSFIPLTVFLLIGIYVSVIDIRTHRIPNQINVIAALLIPVLIYLISGISAVIATLRIGILYFVLFLLLGINSKNSLGMGDVKFSFSCGLIIGYYAPQNWLATIWFMFAAAGLFGLFNIVQAKKVQAKKANSKFNRLGTVIAFGPFMAGSTTLFVLNSLGLPGS